MKEAQHCDWDSYSEYIIDFQHSSSDYISRNSLYFIKNESNPFKIKLQLDEKRKTSFIFVCNSLFSIAQGQSGKGLFSNPFLQLKLSKNKLSCRHWN